MVIKKISEDKLREFKAEAVRRGLKLSEALEEAIDLWLSYKRGEVSSEQDLNNLAYEAQKNELTKKHKGKYAVFASGKLAGIVESLEEVSKLLRKLGVKEAVVVKLGVDEEVALEWAGGSLELKSA